MGANPPFQEAQNICFDNILKLYGQDCTWEKSGGDETALVLFNDPTNPQRFSLIAGRGLAHVGYDNADIVATHIEYRKGLFDGLFELVYQNDLNQYVTTGGQRYVCKSLKSFFDGQTYKIAVEKAETEALISET